MTVATALSVALPVMASFITVPKAIALLLLPSFVTSVWQTFHGGQFSVSVRRLWPFLIAILLASAILAVMAIITNPQPSPLPAPLRRIGQSLSLDWTRLSFGIYGAMPLAILMAFDDGHTNSRTPYLALSALGMVASALMRNEAQ